MWLLIHAGLKLVHVNKKSPWPADFQARCQALQIELFWDVIVLERVWSCELHPWRNSDRYTNISCNLIQNIHAILTHWGRQTYRVSNLTITGLDNGLSPGRHQAIIWTNDGILSIWPLGTNFNEVLIAIHTLSFKEMHLKILSGKWQSFCLCLHVLISHWYEQF